MHNYVNKNKQDLSDNHTLKSTHKSSQKASIQDNRQEVLQQKKLQDTVNRASSRPIQKVENNTGLPDNLKTGVENLSGISMDDVKVHYNSSKPAQIKAHAYTQGTDIHVAPGQQRHIAHEAWHVVQQQQNRVKPTMTLGKANINDSPTLEREADVMGNKALQMKVDESSGEVQRVSSLSLKNISLQAKRDAPIQARLQPLSSSQMKTGWLNPSMMEVAMEAIKRYNAIDVNNLPQRLHWLGVTLYSIDDWIGRYENNTDRKIRTYVQNARRFRTSVITERTSVREEVYAKNQAAILEGRDDGHSLDRHGPEVTDRALKKRLYTGIAPDNVLSPAPGASSQFLTYKDYMQTRTAAENAIRAAVTTAQQAVLHWLGNVFTQLNTVRGQKQQAKTLSGQDRTARELALQNHRQNVLPGLERAVSTLRQQLENPEDELATIDKELASGKNYEDAAVNVFGDLEDDEEDLSDLTERERLQRQARRLVLLQQIALINQNLILPGQQLVQGQQTETVLVNQMAGSIQTDRDRQTELDVATDEVAHPGKSLRRTLTGTGNIRLVIDDNATAGQLGGRVQLEDQYGITIDHNRDVGRGFQGNNELALTDILNNVVDDPTDNPLVPKSAREIDNALGTLNVNNERDALKTHLLDAGNLPRFAAKAGQGAKVYRTVSAAQNLQRTYSNFGVSSKVIFNGTNGALAVEPRNWRLIQHFPTSNNVGIEPIM